MADYRYIRDRRTGVTHRLLGVVDNTLTEEGIAADAKAVRNALALKANKSEPIDTAEAVIGNTGTEDKVPYSFRATGIKSARVREEIVGATVAWNQLIQKTGIREERTIGGAVSFTKDTTKGTVTLSGTATANSNAGIWNELSLNSAHKYLGTYISSSGKLGYFIGDGSRSEMRQGNIAIVSGTTYSLTFYPQLFDLTQMFGSTIANYIYTLEQTTAGAGVAWFRSLFPNPYYAYDAGSLQSVKALMKRSVGKNLYDNASYPLTSKTFINYANGASSSSDSYAATIDYIPFNLAGYTITVNHTPGGMYPGIAFYDKNKNLIGGGKGTAELVPNGCAYMRFTVPIAYADGSDVQIEIGSEATAYEPYESHEYPFDPDLELRGILELDSNNKLRFNGDEYLHDGTVNRRYKIGNLGDLYWTYSSTGDCFYAYVSDKVSGGVRAICPMYTNVGANYDSAMANQPNMSMGFGPSDQNIKLKNSTYSDAALFRTAMDGVYWLYEVDTPTTESADPYQEIQIVDEYGTEEFVDAGVSAGTRDVSVPVGHDSFYYTDIVGRVEGLPDDFSTLIAPTENGFTATRSYSVNDFLIVNNQLYKVTSSISNGGTITPGTNCTATTLGAQITALLNA